MKMTLRIALGVFALLAATGVLYAIEYAKSYRPYVQSIERDCPACGWSFKTKGSNNKPAGAFKGVFEPGTTCPFCGGKGKLYTKIDWQKGEVTAVGVSTVETPVEDGKPDKEGFGQMKLMSQRGADVVAVRNAVEALMQIRLYGTREMPSSYRTDIKAVVKGHEINKRELIENLDKPAAKSYVTVPIWGVKSLCSRFFVKERRKYGRMFSNKRAESEYVESVDEDKYEEETVIVVDVRGEAEFTPHLFPQVVEEKTDGPVYDMTFVATSRATEHGVARYYYMEAEAGSTEELEGDLQSSLDGDPLEGRPACVSSFRGFLFQDDGSAEDGKKKRKKKKKKRVIVVKGKSQKTKSAIKIVVSKEDAEKMAKADETGAAKKKGNVVIITDARIAGKQGILIVPEEKRYADR